MTDRELCVCALLAVLQVPTQLYSHLRGALNVGATAGEVEHALHIAAGVSTPEAQRQALETWRSVRRRVQPTS
jgi:alkylhydroperoxidase/carboxymuconolactone decarboxylase family protein YurZ